MLKERGEKERNDRSMEKEVGSLIMSRKLGKIKSIYIYKVYIDRAFGEYINVGIEIVRKENNDETRKESTIHHFHLTIFFPFA